MKRLFDVESPLMGFLFKVFDCVCLSLLWAAFSLPVLTMGAATAALYATVHKCIQKEEGHLLRTFWNAFRENFKTATVCWIAIALIFAVLVLDAGVFRGMLVRGDAMGNLYWAILLVFAAEATWAAYVFAYCARCNGSTKEVLRISFLLMLYHPLRSGWVFAPILAWAVLALTVPGVAILLPAPVYWFMSQTIEKVFRLHMCAGDLEKECGNVV